ncbi:MAG: hypothetical protein E6767_11370 [Dysgonomonas sp.]|nr:hypothetical protein [Dysgonomonas sp.]
MRIHILVLLLLFVGITHAQTQNSNDSLVVFSPLLNSPVDTLGVVYMQPSSGYYYTPLGDIDGIKSIDQVGNSYLIRRTNGHYKTYGFKANYTSFIDITTVGRLPKLQSEYAQGRDGQWHGADKMEHFSWGPAINSLEYSGTDYAYDKNGTLVASGSGNGIKAKTYDPTDFFRTGVSFGNSVDLKFPGLFRRGISSLSIGQRKNVSPIPNAYKESYNVSYGIEKIKTGKFISQLGALYKSSYGKFTEQGGNLATLMHAVLTTPPTFDNTNGLSTKKAAKQSSAWRLNDGSMRSYNQLVSNPYMLVNELPDREKTDNLVAFAKTEFNTKKFKNQTSFSFDKLWDKRYNGAIFQNLNRNSFKYEHLSNIIAQNDFSYMTEDYDHDLKIDLFANYGFKHSKDKSYKENAYETDVLSYFGDIKNRLHRNAHDIRYGGRFNKNNGNIILEVYNKHYFSNTAKSSDYVNLFPEVGFKWDMESFIDETFDRYDKHFTVYASANRSIGESSLIYKELAVLSTRMSSVDFNNYFEYTDIFFHNGLKPETYTKAELGLKYQTNRGNFNAELNGFYYNTHNFISPVLENNAIANLQNIGRIRNYGYYLNATYQHGFNSYGKNRTYMNVTFNFSQTRNRVSAIYSDAPFIRMVGFENIATVFAKNQSLGTIYGSTYLRNEKGQIVIDDDGFPIADAEMKKIGDPTPDFVMTLSPSFNWRNFGLSFILEYSHGGDRWNGTRAALDYYGASEGTAKNRDIKGYIFKGVSQSGEQNTKAVDFYNPDDFISKNRWVRYGIAGIGEEYIEKATYLRLSNVTLSYTFNNRNRSHFIKSVRLGLRGQNLLLLTKYKGVDPASSLFGYSTGKGLDLFNQPSLRSYSFNLSLDF